MHKLPTYTKIFVLTYFILNIGIINLSAQDTEIWSSPLKKCWEYKSDSLTTLDIASDNDKTIYITNSFGDLIAVNALDGKRRWKTNFGGNFASIPIFYDGKILISSSIEKNSNSTDYLYDSPQSFYKEIEINNGTAVLNIKTDDYKKLSVLKYKDEVYLLSTDGRIELVGNNRKLGWKKQLKTVITTSPLLSGKDLIFGTSNKTLVVINKSSGDVRSQINLNKTPSGFISESTTSYFVGDVVGNIYSIDKVSNIINWKTKVGGRITSTEISGKKLLVQSDDNYAYSISIKKGKKIWKKRMAGRIIGKATIGETIAAYVSQGTNTAIIINTNTGEIINRIVLDSELYFVSSPIFIDQKIILSTQEGLYAFSFKCK